jgi:hypothetical protein
VFKNRVIEEAKEEEEEELEFCACVDSRRRDH